MVIFDIISLYFIIISENSRKSTALEEQLEEIVISLKDVKKVYKVSTRGKSLFGNIANFFIPKYKHIHAVQNISLEIRKGEAVGFIGSNGAGKSTTIKMLSGILYPDNGEINCLGYVPYKQREKYVSRIGVVFGQKSQLIWDLPLIDSFELLKKIYRINQSTYEENLNQFKQILDLDEFINQPVRQLSLGQRMRGEITAALLHSPEIVFFDEPTIGLDVVAKEKVRNFIKYLNKERGITVLFTSHDMRDIESVCDRMILIDRGSIIYDGSKQKLLNTCDMKRKMIIQFAEEYPDIQFEQFHAQQVDQYTKEVMVNDVSDITKIINYVTEKYKVMNISIQEVDIEQVVKRIYQKGSN